LQRSFRLPKELRVVGLGDVKIEHVLHIPIFQLHSHSRSESERMEQSALCIKISCHRMGKWSRVEMDDKDPDVEMLDLNAQTHDTSTPAVSSNFTSASISADRRRVSMAPSTALETVVDDSRAIPDKIASHPYMLLRSHQTIRISHRQRCT
jgi:hypothetical protein